MPELLTVILFVVAPVLHNRLPLHPLAVIVAVSVPHKLVLSLLRTGATGAPPVVIMTALLTPLVPQALLQVAEYIPELLTVIVFVVAPVLHNKLPLHPLAVIVAVSVPHKLVLSLFRTGATGAPPVVMMIALLTPLAPQALPQVAEYVPELLTVMVFVVAPVLHNKPPLHPLAVIVAVSVPHKLVLSLLRTGATGTPPVVIMTALLTPLAPQALPQVAEYVPELLTVIVFVVAPVLHNKLPIHPLAVIVAVSVPHKLVLSLLRTGATGTPPVVMMIALLTPLVHKHCHKSQNTYLNYSL